MKVHVLLGVGILLGLIGASLIVAFGILYVKPYMQVRNMRQTGCITVTAAPGDDVMRCSCQDAGTSCRSSYPCLRVWVSYTTASGQPVSNASLYRDIETFNIQRDAKQCSIHECGRSAQKNMEAVVTFHGQYGENGTQFTCHYQPEDVSYVVIEVTSVSDIIHCMLWPSVALVAGLVILSVYVCDVDICGRKQHKRSHVGSLERPWLRHQTTYQYGRVTAT